MRKGAEALRNFYPRPPRGGRLGHFGFLLFFFGISIHALREEGDDGQTVKAAERGNFYPRPPRGGRQSLDSLLGHTPKISIHALREEGDHYHLILFNYSPISIHALREEGDTAAFAAKH